MAEKFYPIVGFSFKVTFEIDGNTNKVTSQFKEIQGLTSTIQYEEVKEGGENRFVHRLPNGVKFSDLTLAKAFDPNDSLIEWIREAVDELKFNPAQLTISLLDDKQEPKASWRVENAFPMEYSLAKFDAMENAYVIETVKLGYDMFTHL